MSARTRTPDLTSDDVVLGHFTLGRSYPLRERLAIAAEAGVAGIGLFMGDIERWATDDELAAMLDEYGLLLVDLDLINLAAGDDATRSAPNGSCTARPSSPTGSAVATSRRSRRTSSPARLGTTRRSTRSGGSPTRSLRYGVEVGLEYTGFTTVSTLAEAVAVVTACGRPNVGVCIDVWHHTRSRSAVPLAPSVAAPMIRCVQLNDGPLVPVDPDYKTDCLRNRLAPGERRDGRGRLRRPAHRDGCRRAVDGRGVP